MKEIELGRMPSWYARPTVKENWRQIDWEKLKLFINNNKKEISEVTVGLAEDWCYTNAIVYVNDKYCIVENDEFRFYGMSFWATPTMQVCFKNGTTKIYELWKKGNEKDMPHWWLKQ